MAGAPFKVRSIWSGIPLSVYTGMKWSTQSDFANQFEEDDLAIFKFWEPKTSV